MAVHSATLGRVGLVRWGTVHIPVLRAERDLRNAGQVLTFLVLIYSLAETLGCSRARPEAQGTGGKQQCWRWRRGAFVSRQEKTREEITGWHPHEHAVP
jgi:hypothetical protein